MSRPDLTVIVVSWNVRELLLDCLRSVRDTRGALDVEVVVVDNASSDGSVAALARQAPEARVLALDRNVGFPAANNVGLEHAGGRHVLLLNPDTVVGAGTLEACVAALDADPALGAVGCRLEYPDGRVQKECGRRAYRLRHLVWEAFYLNALLPEHPVFAHQLMGDWPHTDDRDVEALSGAFLMVRRDALDQVGGLPEDVFMYHEDLALCQRLQALGWRLRCLGSVSTVHHGGASASRSASPLELLEGEVRTRLIRERSGPVAGGAARLLFGFRQVVRTALAVLVHLPGLAGVRRRYPVVADVGKHGRLLAWTVAPSWALRDVPRPVRRAS